MACDDETPQKVLALGNLYWNFAENKELPRGRKWFSEKSLDPRNSSSRKQLRCSSVDMTMLSRETHVLIYIFETLNSTDAVRFFFLSVK